MIITFLYEKLLARIAAEVAEVKHIDLWNSQTEREQDDLPFARPAVFIEFLEIPKWQTQGLKLQKADLNIVVRVVTDNQNRRTDSKQTLNHRTKSFQRLILFEKVWVALHGYQAYDGESQFSKLVRIGQALDTNANQVNTDRLTFVTNVTDAAAVPEFDEVELKLVLTGDLVPKLPE